MWSENPFIDVFPQSSTEPLFQHFLMREDKKDILLTSDVVVDDEVVSVSTGHGFTAAAGEMMVLWAENRVLQTRVKSVLGDAITIDAPIAQPFTVAGTKVWRGNINMNIDASVTPVEFALTLTDFTIPIDIGFAIISMTHSLAGDDSKFGGISELSNGMYFRKENFTNFNLGNYRNNGDFRDLGADVKYDTKGPGGSPSTSIVFDLEKMFGQVMRLDTFYDDVVKAVMRDNNTNDSMTISVLGSYTSGE